MFEQIDEYLTEFLELRYFLEYEQIDELSIRYQIRDLNHECPKNPLKSKPLKNRLESLGLRLESIRKNKDNSTNEEISIEFHFARI